MPEKKLRGRYRRNYGKEAYELKQKYPELTWKIIGQRIGVTDSRGLALIYEKKLGQKEE